MKRQFKLIKEFPGSSPLGTIYQKNPEEIYFYELHSDDSYDTKWDLDHFFKYSEYYEEIKEYEITSYINPSNDIIFTVIENDICVSNSTGNKYPVSSLYIQHYKIHSIKRLSDGEIFTVGDKITGTFSTDEHPESKGYTVINSFEVVDGMLYIHISTDIYILEQSTSKPFSKLAKYIPKTPILITEDGVNIYEHCTLFVIGKNSLIHQSGLSTKGLIFNKYKDHFFWFSTKEAAKEYLLMNKAYLSINDVLNSQDGLVFAEKKLKELVKSRIAESI